MSREFVIESGIEPQLYILCTFVEDKISQMQFVWYEPQIKKISPTEKEQQTLNLIKRYLNTPTGLNTIEFDEYGTPFQKQVWQQLREIPEGETKSYGEIAQSIGSGARAVANACRKNPLVIITPCHRVVSANGLGGYMGSVDGKNIEIKRWLLKHEGNHSYHV